MTEEIINSDGSRNWRANILLDNVKRLEQENKSLYEEKNCLHKIIDRLLENAGYSKDIASAEDFEDVYEDMQIKRNELIVLEQENKELKEVKEQLKKWNDENLKRQDDMQLWIDLAEEQRKKYRSALEEIRKILNKECGVISNAKVVGIINEVLE